jgi:hypothetical protein
MHVYVVPFMQVVDLFWTMAFALHIAPHIDHTQRGCVRIYDLCDVCRTMHLPIQVPWASYNRFPERRARDKPELLRSGFWKHALCMEVSTTEAFRYTGFRQAMRGSAGDSRFRLMSIGLGHGTFDALERSRVD